jgi:sacsin
VNRLFFHLSQNLAPLVFEIPRAFGAYDTLFRHLGSKENPTMEDYIHLLEEIQEECHSNRLNLNELNAVVKIVMSLTCLMVETNQKLDKETKKYFYLPSQDSILRPLVQMAFNDAPWISNRIDLTEIHLIHSRISDTCCHLLDVPRISSIVYEELHPDFPLVEENEDGLLTLGMSGKEILQVNSLLNSKEFAQALKKIISSQELKCTDNGSGNSNVHGGNGNDRNGLLGDTMLDQENGQWLANFEKLDQQIMELGSFQVKAVEAIQSRFFARLDLHHHPSSSRVVEVTKMSTSKDSMYFIDLNRRIIFIARKKIESMPGIRVTQTLACCINQLLGGKIQDLSVLESILSCHTEEMPHVLQLLNVEDNPELVMERLRGIPGEIVSEKDQEMIELAPMRSFLTGEIIAVEQEGYLRYAKIMHQEMTSCGINRVELKLNKDHIEWVSATRIYAFRSSRRSNTQEEKKNSHNTVGQAADFFTTPPSASSSSEMNARVALIAQESVTIKTTTAVSSLTLENSSSSFSFSPPVKDIQLIDAVNDILSRMNLSLSSTYEELITENIRLQKRLEQVEEARRVAISQIDEAMQEKKDALDSLVCAICLEHNVDRVLIPCGHIFCSDCVHKFPRPTCPICRQEITNSSLFHLPS